MSTNITEALFRDNPLPHVLEDIFSYLDFRYCSLATMSYMISMWHLYLYTNLF